jgi:dGTPase
MLTRKDLEQLERETLAPYAALSAETRGREHPIAPDWLRTEYQRDRDRVIHCAAFRKLEYKTQVYVIHEGDYYRTRLTHTMEVAQIARTLARSLRLNPDLTEAVALAHDLGHTPFGHSGETALHRMMEDAGGFEHNRQGIRVVERLEERYREYPGLNLTWEVREGIAKHRTVYDSPRIERFKPDLAPPLEAQVVDIADEIAFNHHDLDDALKMEIVSRADLADISWVDELCRDLEHGERVRTDGLDAFVRFRLIGRMIDSAVQDVLRQTDHNLREARVESLDDVRKRGSRLVSFSDEARARNGQLSAFLMEKVYQHPRVVRMATKSERFVERLFGLYASTPRQLPIKYQKRMPAEGLKSVIADYISGMTDRYCLEEYKRAFLPQITM